VAGWLLDTVVVSELRKPRCDANVRDWAAAQAQETLFLSSVTMAEIRFGIGRLDAGDPFGAELEAWLEGMLRPWFAGRILAVDEAVLLAWREMVQRGRARRHTFAQPDLFIAATAEVHGLVVVTRNVEDFEVAGVRVLNPWLASPRFPRPGRGARVA
jgi:predicted nucleic acid-binding protein